MPGGCGGTNTPVIPLKDTSRGGLCVPEVPSRTETNKSQLACRQRLASVPSGPLGHCLAGFPNNTPIQVLSVCAWAEPPEELPSSWGVRAGPSPTLGSSHRALALASLGGQRHTLFSFPRSALGSCGLLPSFPATRGRNIWRARKKREAVTTLLSRSPPARLGWPVGRRLDVLCACQECRDSTAVPTRAIPRLWDECCWTFSKLKHRMPS